MIKQTTNWHRYFTGILGLCLSLALHADAQTRGGGGGGGFGGGGFGGGGFGGGGGSRSSTSSTSAGSTSRTYPNNTTIGDAYFSIDPETHRVVYIADEATAKYIGQVLTNLDRPKPQVLIKVVFLEVTRNDSSDIGVEGSFSKSIGNSGSSGLVTNFTVANPGTPTAAIVPSSITPAQSLPFVSAANTFGSQPPASSSLAGANGLYQILGQDYQATIHAIAQAGRAKVLSRPSILARNNQPATITVGQEVPLITGTTYDSLGNTHNAYSYTSVGVILKVTPFITEDGLVEMMVSPQISQIDPGPGITISANANGSGLISAPIIDIRSADTVAVTPDGQTVVIGGLMQTTKTETVTKIPLVGDIPLLGNLFRRTQKNDAKSELIIFLTPHIVMGPKELAALSAKERERSAASKGMTEEELNKFLDELPKQKSSPNSTPKSGKGALVSPPKGS
jgi:general secretion pathway protein D